MEAWRKTLAGSKEHADDLDTSYPTSFILLVPLRQSPRHVDVAQKGEQIAALALDRPADLRFLSYEADKDSDQSNKQTKDGRSKRLGKEPTMLG